MLEMGIDHPRGRAPGVGLARTAATKSVTEMKPAVLRGRATGATEILADAGYRSRRGGLEGLFSVTAQAS
jgi:hypothetical protein